MKRLKPWAWLALLALLCLPLSACSRQEAAPETVSGDLSVYASFYPIYAMADLILDGVDGVNLHCLVQPQDGCLRSYQISDWDLALLASADAVIAGGRGLESFESLLYALGEDGPAVSAVLYDMDLVNQRAANTSDDADSHWLEDNPHIYMDVDGAKEIAGRIAATMKLIDPEHEAAYDQNLQAAESKLDALKNELDSTLEHLRGGKVIVMNEALIYSGADFGLEVELCYEHESGEDLAGADLEACLKQLESCVARVILLEKQAPQALQRALTAAGYRVARMDTLSTRRADEGYEGYFQAQRANAQAIIEAFSGAN